MEITGGLRRWETLKDRDIEAIWLAESTEATEDVTPYQEDKIIDSVSSIEKQSFILFPKDIVETSKGCFDDMNSADRNNWINGAKWQEEKTKYLQYNHDKLLEQLKVALQYMEVFMVRGEEPLPDDNLKTDLYNIRHIIEKCEKVQ